jgi:hypothetical protein
MALELMLSEDKTIRRSLLHDLESVLYVILYVCTLMDGPRRDRRTHDTSILRVPLCQWFDAKANLSYLGHMKLGHIVDADRAILDQFPPYWKVFKPFVKRLLHAFFPRNPIDGCFITPEVMLSVLKDAVMVIDIVEI